MSLRPAHLSFNLIHPPIDFTLTKTIKLYSFLSFTTMEAKSTTEIEWVNSIGVCCSAVEGGSHNQLKEEFHAPQAEEKGKSS